MLLPDREIAEAVTTGQLVIDPFEPGNLQPSSLDLRLGRLLRVFLDGPEPVDPAVDTEPYTKLVEVGEHYLMPPGQLVLASTHERIRMPAHLAGRVEGKSSLGRLGLAVHVTAGFIDPGFDGTVTLELFSVHRTRSVVLHPGMRIAQLCVIPMLARPARTYGSIAYQSHYQGQRGPTPSRAHIGFTCW